MPIQIYADKTPVGQKILSKNPFGGYSGFTSHLNPNPECKIMFG